jgi:hypothetical protein
MEALKTVSFDVSRRFRDRGDIEPIEISDRSTLNQLREKICQEFNLKPNPEHFSLLKFDISKGIWVAIEESRMNQIIGRHEFCDSSILTLEFREQHQLMRSGTSQRLREHSTLYLCQELMNRECYTCFDIRLSETIGQLKKRIEQLVQHRRIDQLLLWKTSHWKTFKQDSDDISLAEAGFLENSFISVKSLGDPIPGVCGLKNLGSTCFFNSALQCLSHVPELTEKILSFCDDTNPPIINAYALLLKTLWSGHHTVADPWSLFNSVSENLPRFARSRQQDVHEFMSHFLQMIHQEMSNPKTFISDLFHGKMRSTVHCQCSCQSKEMNDETISFLPLPMSDNTYRYEILFLRSNGEQKLLMASVDRHASKIEDLIQCFRKEEKLYLNTTELSAVRMVDNEIVKIYSNNDWLDSVIKHQLAFIEIPTMMKDETNALLYFIDQNTRKPFRPPILIGLSRHHYLNSNITDQIGRIQMHLNSVKVRSIPILDNISWVNNDYSYYPLELSKYAYQHLHSVKQMSVKVDHEYALQYAEQFRMNRSCSSTSLNTLLDDFFRMEKVNGDYHCSQCSAQVVAKQKSDLILPLPPVLVIQLKRFTNDCSSSEKINTFIDFPLNDLDPSKYALHPENGLTNESILYELAAVSNHNGSLISGHYITFAKNVRNKQWYSFNDNRTEAILDEKNVVTKDAYILVYVKQNAC